MKWLKAMCAIITIAMLATGCATEKARMASSESKDGIRDFTAWMLSNPGARNSVTNGYWSRDPKAAPTDAELARMLKTALLPGSAHMLTPVHFVVIRDYSEQKKILSGMDGMASEGTVAVLILADELRDKDHHQESYNDWYQQMYYGIMDAGYSLGYLNLAAISMPVIEDCFEEEIGFLGGSAKPLASMDTQGLVFYLGTFSKVLFPGLRLGWIAASPAWAERLTLLRSATSITGSALIQAAVARLIEEGSYEAHVRRVNRVFSRRLGAGLESFYRNVPSELARLEGPPSGGYLLWVSLVRPRRGFEAGRGRGPVTAYEGRIVGASAREGLVVAPGSPFWPGDPPGPFLRLSLAGHESEEIEEGMIRLNRALKSVAASSRADD